MRISLVVLVFAFAGLLAVDLAVVVGAARGGRDAERAPCGEAGSARRSRSRSSRTAGSSASSGSCRRALTPQETALRELTQGPTKLERRQGIRTALPETARLRSLRRLRGRRGSRASRARRSALARPRRSARGSGRSRPRSPRLGDKESSPSRRRVAISRLRGSASDPGTWRAETGEKDYPYVVRGVQLRLSALGYLDRSDATGSTNYLTEQALLAFQGWEGLDRTGTVTGQTQVALFTAARPKPASRRPGKHIEISRDRGVLLMVEDGEVVRAVHTSTGSLGRTPVGDFKVYVKSLYSWSVPFHVWMPYAAYFRGGIATHQSPDVPSYPASHGCVRLPEGEAERVYDFVDVGTPVAVR